MIVYQVKIKIDPTAEAEWIKWMKTRHVPDVLSTGLILSAQILQSQDQQCLYYFNYYFESLKEYQQYHNEHGPTLKAHTQERYGGKFVASRQLLNMI